MMNRKINSGMNMIMRAALIALFGVLVAPDFSMAQPTGAVSLPPGLSGFGTLSVTNASAAISTMTRTAGSATFVQPLTGTLSILNAKSSAGNVYICFFGGVCTNAIGFPVVPGQQVYGINLGGSTVSPTVIADTTATIWITW